MVEIPVNQATGLLRGLCACGCGVFVVRQRSRRQKLNLPFVQGHWNKGQNHGLWKGGFWVDRDGYKLVKRAEHPMANNQGYIREHRLVMSEHIGRALIKTEVVHHINGNPLDNRIENLRLVGQSLHARIEGIGRHTRIRSGTLRPCGSCGTSIYRVPSQSIPAVRFCNSRCRGR